MSRPHCRQKPEIAAALAAPPLLQGGHLLLGVLLVRIVIELLPFMTGGIHWSIDLALALLAAGYLLLSRGQHDCPQCRATSLGAVIYPYDGPQPLLQQLRRENAILRAQFDTTPTSIIAVSHDEQVLLMNRSFQKMWRLSPEQLTCDSRQLKHNCAAQFVDPAAFLARQDELRDHPLHIVRDELAMKNGVVLSRYSAPLFCEDGTCIGRLYYHRDVTEQHRNASQIREWQDRYATAIDASGQVLYDWHLGSPQATWSGSCEAMLGYTAAELEHSVEFVISLVHPDDLEHFNNSLAYACRYKTPFDISYRMRRKDGRYIDVRGSGRFYRTGNDDRMIGFLTDVSSERNAVRLLQRSEQLSRAIIDELASALVILDESGTVLAANRAWEQTMRENAHIGIGDSYLAACDAAGTPDAVAIGKGIRDVLDARVPEFHLDCVHGDQAQQQVWAVRVSRFEIGNETRLLVVHDDIPSRRTAERLARDQAALREAVTAMEHVLGVVGHELRTPLASLRAICEFLVLDGAHTAAEWPRFLRDMGSEVDRMSETVHNLLEAARINSGRARWNWGRLCACQVCLDALESVRPLVDTRNVALTIDVDTAACAMIGDAEALRRLITNLLSNARRHTHYGRIGVSVTSSTDPDTATRWVRIAVSDTGDGIPEDIRHRLGQAFALNAGSIGNRFAHGAGLGLAICRGIAAAHGGQLSIDSTVGKGTTVLATLRADLPAAAEGDTVLTSEPEGIAA